MEYLNELTNEELRSTEGGTIKITLGMLIEIVKGGLSLWM
jgi:lactobin A/cerein 7B family class IIb bacteriocin